MGRLFKFRKRGKGPREKQQQCPMGWSAGRRRRAQRDCRERQDERGTAWRGALHCEECLLHTSGLKCVFSPHEIHLIQGDVLFAELTLLSSKALFPNKVALSVNSLSLQQSTWISFMRERSAWAPGFEAVTHAHCSGMVGAQQEHVREEPVHLSTWSEQEAGVSKRWPWAFSIAFDGIWTGMAGALFFLIEIMETHNKHPACDSGPPGWETSHHCNRRQDKA